MGIYDGINITGGKGGRELDGCRGSGIGFGSEKDNSGGGRAKSEKRTSMRKEEKGEHTQKFSQEGGRTK